MASLTANQHELKLLHWLEHDTDRFEKYITAHPEIADRIESLLDTSHVRERFSEVFAEAVSVPMGLAERLTASIGRDRSTDASSVVLDVLGVGARTFGWFLSDNP